MAGIIVYIPFSVISFIGSVESLDGIFIPPLVFSTNEIPISPPTSENRFTNVRLSVRVGGLIGRVSSSNNGWVDKDLDFFHRYVITSDTDFNVITKPGMYNLYATKSTNNSPGYDYGLLVVFSSGGQILQIAADVFSQRYCLRTRRDNGVWTSWKGIALT